MKKLILIARPQKNEMESQMKDREYDSLDYDEIEEEKIRRRRQRIEEMKKEKLLHQQSLLRIKRVFIFAAIIFLAVGITALIVTVIKPKPELKPEPEEVLIAGVSGNDAVVQHIEEIERHVISENEVLSTGVTAKLEYPYGASTPQIYGLFDGYEVKKTESTGYIWNEEVISEYAVLINAGTGNVVAQREADTRINPASMTKILTLLVAAEHITDLEEPVTITIETTDYAFSNDLSAVGFDRDETVTVRDLLYGTILPSGGDAAYALACHICGSQDAFVELMNDKLQELGIASTAHFTNCVGLYDENHYCTVTDMAIILKAAVENELCREVLSAHTYTTSFTQQHPEGITISNLFLRRIEDKDTHGEVLCAKTGFVAQSGNCAASYAISNSGEQYICVTAKSSSAWKCIYDHVRIYTDYTH